MICLLLLLQLKVIVVGDSLAKITSSEKGAIQKDESSKILLYRELEPILVPQLHEMFIDPVYKKQGLNCCLSDLSYYPKDLSFYNHEKFKQEFLNLSEMSSFEEMSMMESRRAFIYGIDGVPRIKQFQVNIADLIKAIKNLFKKK